MISSRVMGVINLTSHSFYQGTPAFSDALFKAEMMVKAGAALIDVGAIATNPFINVNDIPSEQTELDLILPFVDALSKRVDTIISVDTSRAAVMTAAVNAGANMINDQRALTEENALKTAVKLSVPVCLMHHFNPTRTPGDCSPADLLSHIKNDLQKYSERCLSAGMSRNHIILDPGFGGGHFGKNAAENFYVLAHLKEIVTLGFPVLVGLSRKSLFADIQADVNNRLSASIAAATIAAMNGAAIVRVHDVQETVDAMRVIELTTSPTR